MEPYRLPYADTGRFAPLVLDHVTQDPFVRSLGGPPPTWEGLIAAARSRVFSDKARATLVTVLEQQYTDIERSAAVIENFEHLARKTTVTVTTGHQLCLFTGPLYVTLKILNTVKLAGLLTDRLGDKRVVPIFWMATEDHDRPEIDHAWVNGKKIHWPGEIGGAVGPMPLIGIEKVVEEARIALGQGTNAQELHAALTRCYRPEHSLAKATRMFVNEMFGHLGVICLDANEPGLKELFLPTMREELLEQFGEKAIVPVNERIASRYKVQAHPREINLFHSTEGRRVRIVPAGRDKFFLEGVGAISRSEILLELNEHPERYSPNVLLRPLYQETILPNVCYIGGGGELAYWLQLGALFAHAGARMPVLLLRSSMALLPHKELVRAEELGLSIQDLFAPREELRKRIAKAKAGFATDVTEDHASVKAIFDQLTQRARSIDPTLERSAGSAALFAFKGLEHLEKRFIRAAKARSIQELSRLDMVLEVLFPNGGMQERKENFMTFYSRMGVQLFVDLLEHLDPLGNEFTVLVEGPLGSERVGDAQ